MKKPWYKRWKVWGGTFAVLFVIGMFAPEEIEKPEVPEVAAKVEAKPEAKESKTPVVAIKSAEEVAAEEAEAARIAEVEKENAAKAAEAAKVKAEAEAAAKLKAENVAKKKAEKAAAAESVREALKALVDLSGGVVSDIMPSPHGKGDWETTHVIVSDAWYDSADHEKERFADSVGGAVKLATNGEAKLVHFYDAYGKVLAKEKAFGGYDIKW